MRFFILFLLLTSFASQAEIVSRNITVNYNKIKVVDNYSIEDGRGLIRIKLCSSCKEKELLLDANTLFTVAHKVTELNQLLHTRLSQPSEAVRIQYNYKDNTVSFIHWNYIDPEGEI